MQKAELAGVIYATGAEVQTLDTPRVKFWMDPYIPEDSIVIAHGKFSTAKTPIMSNIAKAIAQGAEEILGCPTRKAKVLFVQADTPRDIIVPRLKALDVGVPDLDFVFAYPGFDILNPSTDESSVLYYNLLHTLHREHSYQVVMIDALRGIHTEDDKESATVHKVYRALRRLFPGATVVLIHHDRKYSQDGLGDESFSGSQAWGNHATVVMKFSRPNKREEVFRIEHTKTQASELVPPIEVRLVDGTHIQTSPHSDEKAIRAKISALRGAGLLNKEIDAQAADYFGVSERTIRRRREKLEASEGQLASGQ